jgi:hypothetical protein
MIRTETAAGRAPSIRADAGLCRPPGTLREQIGAQGRALENFSQALTHLSLIGTAFNLDRYLDRARGARAGGLDCGLAICLTRGHTCPKCYHLWHLNSSGALLKLAWRTKGGEGPLYFGE